MKNKLNLNSKDLFNSLSKLTGVVKSSPVLPILECVLFEVKENNLKLRATDLETTIVTNLKVESSEDFRVCIPCDILVQTLKALPDHPIEITIDEVFNIELKSNYGNYKFQGNEPSEFPNEPSKEDSEPFKVPSNKLLEAISNTSFCTGNDEIRLAMNGVYFEIENGSVTLTATDAHKLSNHKIESIEIGEEGKVIVPKKGLSIIKNNLGKIEEVSVSYTLKNIFFDLQDTHYCLRLIDAKYPDYKAVIPSNNPNVLSVNRTDLLSCLQRVSVFANKTSNQVNLILSQREQDGLIRIEAMDLDCHNEAKEELECSYDGDDMEISFNAKFLMEMLSNMKTEEVVININTPNSAATFELEKETEESKLLMLLMPVMKAG